MTTNADALREALRELVAVDDLYHMEAPGVEKAAWDAREKAAWAAARAALAHRERAPSTEFPTSGDSDNRASGSEHSRTDGEVPEAPDAALQQQRPRWDKSTGHGRSDQGAERPDVGNLTDRERAQSVAEHRAAPKTETWTLEYRSALNTCGHPKWVTSLAKNGESRVICAMCGADKRECDNPPAERAQGAEPVAVPREPTDAMIDVGYAALSDADEDESAEDMMARTWRAMWDAATGERP